MTITDSKGEWQPCTSCNNQYPDHCNRYGKTCYQLCVVELVGFLLEMNIISVHTNFFLKGIYNCCSTMATMDPSLEKLGLVYFSVILALLAASKVGPKTAD